MDQLVKQGFKRYGHIKVQGCVQTDVMSRNHKTICCPLQIVNTNFRGTPEKKQDCQSDKDIKRERGKGRQ